MGAAISNYWQNESKLLAIEAQLLEEALQKCTRDDADIAAQFAAELVQVRKLLRAAERAIAFHEKAVA